MNLEWSLIFKGAWSVFWITTVYSYLACSVIGFITGYRTKNDKKKIDEEIEKFIISPFYVATFFSLFSVLFFYHGTIVKNAVMIHPLFSVLFVGILVFLGHLLVELLESTFIRRDPLRMLNDKDAIRLSGIYLLIIAVITLIIFLT